MDAHGTEVVCPQFKFERISQYSDPLRRQLCEALNIIDKGTLNGKYEFGINELCRLECSSSTREREDVTKLEIETRTINKMKMKSFIDVMSKLHSNSGMSNVVNISRIKRPESHCHFGCSAPKRLKTMETSTPNHFDSQAYRLETVDSDDNSPIMKATDVVENQCECEEVELIDYSTKNCRTNLSDKLDKTKLTPVKPISNSAEERFFMGGTADLTNAAVAAGLIRRSSSLPDICQLEDNSFFIKLPARWQDNSMLVRWRSNSVGRRSIPSADIDFSKWSTNDFEEVDSGEDTNNDPGCGEDTNNDPACGEDTNNVPVCDGKQLNVEGGGNICAPLVGGFKRILNISPETPVGLPRKHSVTEASPALREINHREDGGSLQHLPTPSSNDSTVVDRIFKRGLRRAIFGRTDDRGKTQRAVGNVDGLIKQTPDVDCVPSFKPNLQKDLNGDGEIVGKIKQTPDTETMNMNSTSKGIAVKKLLNFKTRKRRVKVKERALDPSQKRINEIFPRKEAEDKSNNIVTGPDNGVDVTEDDDSMV